MATLFGMIVAIQPVVAICCMGVFLLVLLPHEICFTKFYSVRRFFCYFILFIFNDDVTLYRVFSVLVALLVIINTQKNINRIYREPKAKYLF